MLQLESGQSPLQLQLLLLMLLLGALLPSPALASLLLPNHTLTLNMEYFDLTQPLKAPLAGVLVDEELFGQNNSLPNLIVLVRAPPSLIFEDIRGKVIELQSLGAIAVIIETEGPFLLPSLSLPLSSWINNSIYSKPKRGIFMWSIRFREIAGDRLTLPHHSRVSVSSPPLLFALSLSASPPL